MTNQSRKARGRRTEKVLAAYYAERGWAFAESTGAGRSGVDITGMPGLSIEVKARRAFDPVSWLRQAATRPGLPFVVFRPNGLGEQSVGKWGVLMTVEDHVQLLQEAGYGSHRGEDQPRPEPDQQEAHDHDELDAVLGPSADLTVAHDDHGTAEAAS